MNFWSQKVPKGGKLGRFGPKKKRCILLLFFAKIRITSTQNLKKEDLKSLKSYHNLLKAKVKSIVEHAFRSFKKNLEAYRR